MTHLLLSSSQVGQLLQSARKAAGRSQTDLALQVGLSQSRLSKLEQHPGAMTVDQLLVLCGSLCLELSLQRRTAVGPDAPTNQTPSAPEW